MFEYIIAESQRTLRLCGRMAAFTGMRRENSGKRDALRQISNGVRISKGVFESAMVNQQWCLNQQCYLRAQREDKKDTDSTEK